MPASLCHARTSPSWLQGYTQLPVLAVLDFCCGLHAGFRVRRVCPAQGPALVPCRLTGCDVALVQPRTWRRVPAEAKYEREYSASIDPFTAWRLKERERGRAGMALHDRLLYAAGQAVATNSCASFLQLRLPAGHECTPRSVPHCAAMPSPGMVLRRCYESNRHCIECFVQQRRQTLAVLQLLRSEQLCQ